MKNWQVLLTNLDGKDIPIGETAATNESDALIQAAAMAERRGLCGDVRVVEV